MSRFNIQDIEKYGTSGSSSFFSLKDNLDTARVRFMYNGIEDVVGHAVHEVKIENKTRYVSCLRKYDEPKSKCPLCEANNLQKARIFILLYNIDEEEPQVWDRGPKFVPQISSICARYSSADVPLVSHIFEIERNGAKGSQTTTYGVFDMGADDTTLEDLPEAVDPIGTIVLQKTAEEMAVYLDTGAFPNEGGEPRRRGSGGRQSADEAPTRRTPSRVDRVF